MKTNIVLVIEKITFIGVFRHVRKLILPDTTQVM